mmetsp:Transcript_16786/g.23765  ORF Transcript_16786/g.23765 Transcript_16786/m.23765 type:complete len:651 (-) Transcript_16786:253-2205(-)|eukprot:CAMPEP_0184869900 /NCGR_PEP_ID=MMETSP0580-20130426/35734_1 /TAXON_ID=1118495 /ORGANISM="Dactyliosolen fragilissimus" /LENGTH=650 /DNA_ID=CAMNT_0027371697 /DNA_START=332 /DNA_END=2284 /DNA_ORIENTATION=-
MASIDQERSTNPFDSNSPPESTHSSVNTHQQQQQQPQQQYQPGVNISNGFVPIQQSPQQEVQGPMILQATVNSNQMAIPTSSSAFSSTTSKEPENPFDMFDVSEQLPSSTVHPAMNPVPVMAQAQAPLPMTNAVIPQFDPNASNALSSIPSPQVAMNSSGGANYNNSNLDKGGDFFGDFSSNRSNNNHNINPSQQSYNNPTPVVSMIEVKQNHIQSDNLSDFSRSTTATEKRTRNEKFVNQALAARTGSHHPNYQGLGNNYHIQPSSTQTISSRSTTHTRQSRASQATALVDDPTFAPPPQRPASLPHPNTPKAAALTSLLPNFDLVGHSGELRARLTFGDLVRKKWRDCYWISYGRSRMIFFRSKTDFIDWISNPYLNNNEREKLVRFSVDFVQDLYFDDVLGYQVTKAKHKNYRDGFKSTNLYQFKLEKWMSYGPIISAAFASKNMGRVNELRTIMLGLMKRSPENAKLVGRLPSQTYNDDNRPSYLGGGPGSIYSREGDLMERSLHSHITGERSHYSGSHGGSSRRSNQSRNDMSANGNSVNYSTAAVGQPHHHHHGYHPDNKHSINRSNHSFSYDPVGMHMQSSNHGQRDIQSATNRGGFISSINASSSSSLHPHDDNRSYASSHYSANSMPIVTSSNTANYYSAY